MTTHPNGNAYGITTVSLAGRAGVRKEILAFDGTNCENVGELQIAKWGHASTVINTDISSFC